MFDICHDRNTVRGGKKKRSERWYWKRKKNGGVAEGDRCVKLFVWEKMGIFWVYCLFCVFACEEEEEEDIKDGGGIPCCKAQGRVLNDSQKTESFTLASAIQPGALVGEFFLCVFIEVCIERAQKL